MTECLNVKNKDLFHLDTKIQVDLKRSQGGDGRPHVSEVKLVGESKLGINKWAAVIFLLLMVARVVNMERRNE